jgi:hypothetical protein
VNGIRYEYERKHLPVHVVVCEESWEEVDPDKAEILTKNARHVWISSEPLRWDMKSSMVTMTMDAASVTKAIILM